MENKKKRQADICAAPYRQSPDRQSRDAETAYESSEKRQLTPDKLLTRATQINNSLLLSLNAVLDAKVAIDADLLACKELACELTNWERALAELEGAIIANHFDKDASGSATKDTGTETTPVRSGISDISKNDNNKLLQTIKLQKAQIGALENKLNKMLQNQSAAPPTPDKEYSAEKPGPEETSTQSNRVLISIARSGNLKYPISRNVMTIGRQPTNDIHIRSRYLSRRHARIVSEKKGAFIEDLDSANGVIVNSRRVRRCLLRSGDRITLGKTQMQYIDIEEDTEDAGQA